jgi:glucose-6-phosphate isomerase
MLKINFENLGKLDLEKYDEQLRKIKSLEKPDFEAHTPNLEEIKSEAEKYQKYKNIILIANGGSRTNTLAFYNSLASFRNDVNFEFLPSDEPFLINQIKKRCSKNDTLVLVVSKSGDNINNIEPLMFFLDYPVVAITGENDAALSQLVAILGWGKVIHPNVSGRFSGLTTCALFPASLMGLDIKEIYAGAEDGYKKYNQEVSIENNDALKLALMLVQSEKKNYDEIFASVYSTCLCGFLPLITQLIHESAGKNGNGQTIFGDYSPETQHHTTQRIFGGKRNTVVIFVNEEEVDQNVTIKIPENLKDVIFRGKTLGVLDGISGNASMHFDMQGVFEHCLREKIPNSVITMQKINPRSIGEFMVFWQYVAYYLAVFLEADPFTQPEVEIAKEISFELRNKK